MLSRMVPPLRAYPVPLIEFSDQWNVKPYIWKYPSKASRKKREDEARKLNMCHLNWLEM
ncbi:hypothetical protein SFC57_18080 [Niallia circulans]|uniref:hypothetical protein n=1 Tax=Niallia circulans TaxID=1397 RepID=UPI0015608552|nr:hypothetical protein [Niallia circulans]NRG32121.1 hypothetical protein [Niallia circulans]